MAITYSISGMKLDDLAFTGRASCEGGRHPSPGLHNYPLLAWMHTGHPKHGRDVFTEDQRASVPDIARALPESPSIDALAERFGTTPGHVTQALDYAMECGVLAAREG